MTDGFGLQMSQMVLVMDRFIVSSLMGFEMFLELEKTRIYAGIRIKFRS